MKKTKSKKLTQRVHREYLLREAGHFREHKKGIPEWIKNSDDSYTRHEELNTLDCSELPILLNISKHEVNCLDFGGATSKDMIEHIPYYGSPDAATHGKSISSTKISGGHGNGGKYYALSQFKECKIVSYFLGKLTILRINKDGDFVDAEKIDATPQETMDILDLYSWEYFEKTKEGRSLFEKLKRGQLNMFCWKGIEPKDKKPLTGRRNLSKLLHSISNHPQSRAALKNRKVIALVNGEAFWPSLKPNEVEPDEAFGTREFALPNRIGKFKFNKHIKSSLRIILSREPLTGENSSLNILEIDALGKNIAYYEIPQLLMDKGLSKCLYAYIDCPELREYECVNNDRVHLIDDLEVTELFIEWCKSKLKEVLEELTNKEKKRDEKRHLEELGEFLKEITDEISELLEEENIVKFVFKKDGEKLGIVEVPTNKVGFGLGDKIKQKGKGIRLGGKEDKETTVAEKKNKSKLQILLSNHDPDPLNLEGRTYDMIERQPVLHQRLEDVDYGIWWINSQKSYVRKLKIKDPGAIPFYFFLVKEIVFSQRARKRFKEQEMYDPDALEDLNFKLIDEIFNKVIQRLNLELSLDSSIAEKIRETIKSKGKFSTTELSKELEIDPVYITNFINNPTNGVLDNFRKTKEGKRNIYIRK